MDKSQDKSTDWFWMPNDESKDEEKSDTRNVDTGQPVAETNVPVEENSSACAQAPSARQRNKQKVKSKFKPNSFKRTESNESSTKRTDETNKKIFPTKSGGSEQASGSYSGQTSNDGVVTFETRLRFFNYKTDEFIRKERQASKKIKQLNISARLLHAELEIVLSNFGCLLLVDEGFVAEVRIEHPEVLDGTRTIWEAKQVLFNQLKIERVLHDELNSTLEQYQNGVVFSVENRLRQSPKDQEKGIAWIQLTKLVEKFDSTERLTYFRFFQEIENSKFFNDVLKAQIKITLEIDSKVFKRSHFLEQLGRQREDTSKALYQRLKELLLNVAEHHKSVLMEKAPEALKSSLSKLSRERLMLVTEKDVKIFADMRSILKEEIFAKPLEDVEQRWAQQVESFQISHLNRTLDLSNETFLFLCKSLQEVILEMSEKSGLDAQKFLQSSPSEWQPVSRIDWKAENLLTKCLERQYRFIFRLLKHFSLRPTFVRKGFQYEIQFLIRSDTSSTVKSGLKSMVKQAKKVVGKTEPNSNHLGVTDELYVWYCLLDDALAHVLPKDFDTSDIQSSLESYTQMIQETKPSKQESVRVATHNTLRNVINVVSYMTSANDRLPVDRRILQQQMAVTGLEESSNMTRYRDLVNVFSTYWESRSEVISRIESEMPLPEMAQLKKQLLSIVSLALERQVDNEHFVKFFQTYDEFLINLNEVPKDWFIKRIPKINMEGLVSLSKVQIVDNKLKDSPNPTYRVIDSKNFSTFCKVLEESVEVPKHYMIEALKRMFSIVESQLRKAKWSTNTSLNEEDKLTTTCDLLSAMRQSLPFMREQPEYESFELFLEEMVNPFNSLTKNSTTLQDFSTRVQLLTESFWFFRKQNQMDVDTALQFYQDLNLSADVELLKFLVQKYSQHFHQFMQLSAGTDSHEAAAHIAEEVKKLIPLAEHFTMWNNNFKQNTVPQILAGLAAVWSTQVSKDISSTGKYLSPHYMQILCVLRLLSADHFDNGSEVPSVDKHLAQVLTGQGKSLILALVAAFLALTGHKVNIACYSRYLVERDEDNFFPFFAVLNIKLNLNVTYGTLHEMMEKFINPDAFGRAKGLRSLVEDLLFYDKPTLPRANMPDDLSKTVLLIDEVDVFFTEQFYGSIYGPCATPDIKGIEEIQVLVWETVSKGVSDSKKITERVWTLINSSNFTELNKFLVRNQSYELLTVDCTLKSYDNRSLFDEHLIRMIECAIAVFKKPSDWSMYKLNSFEQISYNVNGEYVTSTKWSYYNVFNYFRLKKRSFVPVINGQRNYGYLNIECGSLSYAMLPNICPLILGVSGTLTGLNDCEKQTIEQIYNIKKLSLIPTFFGGSNLIFDETENFHPHDMDSSWKGYIYRRANIMMASNRAVIIFFESDEELEAFQAAYGNHFDRLNVLTENSDDKEKLINEAAIAKTVTLATRGMGRGVDYKSSVVVEKNGGVHVMQTFFSMDVKEEAQIKGRTARQENKGSYELIVCKEKLHSSMKTDGLKYSNMVEKRKEIANKSSKKLSDVIESNKNKHDQTIKYMESFYDLSSLPFQNLFQIPF